MATFGLVLGAGGDRATAFHAGALATLTSAIGWDPRTVHVLVGTSAGATAAATLRAGLSAQDMLNRITGEPLSSEGRALADRVTTAWQSRPAEQRSKAPGNPALIARSVLGGSFRPGLAFAGAMPRGTVDGTAVGKRIDELHGTVGWPKAPTWIVTVRQSDGKRVTLGRDDVTVPSIGKAVQASTAVPGTFVPVRIDGHDYVDGAVHSTTNADLLAGLGLDAVVVLSAKSIAPAHANWREDPTRTYYRRTLQSELEKVQKTGTPVMAVEPGPELLELFAQDPLDSAAISAAAGEAMLGALDRSRVVAERLRADAGGTGGEAA